MDRTPPTNGAPVATACAPLRIPRPLHYGACVCTHVHVSVSGGARTTKARSYSKTTFVFCFGNCCLPPQSWAPRLPSSRHRSVRHGDTHHGWWMHPAYRSLGNIVVRRADRSLPPASSLSVRVSIISCALCCCIYVSLSGSLFLSVSACLACAPSLSLSFIYPPFSGGA